MKLHPLFGLAFGLVACQAPAGLPAHATFENDFVVPRSSGIGRAEQDLTIGDGPNSQQVVYVNFGGQQITVIDQSQSQDDARTNKSWIPNTASPGSTITIPAFDTSPYVAGGTYTDASAKAAIIADVQSWYASYNVYVVTTRPTSGRYTMVVVGGTTDLVLSGAGSGTVGIAPLDCDNSSQVNVAFAFAKSINDINPASDSGSQMGNLLEVAQTVAHECGHTLGLEHVNKVQDIMDPTVSTSVTGFLSGGNALSSTPAQCDSGTSTSRQDDNARLLSNPGPAPTGPVVAKPTITWLAPKDGDTVGADFTAQVSVTPASSSSTITKVQFSDGTNVNTVTTAPWLVQFGGTPDGNGYSLTATAFDSSGTQAALDVSFNVSSSATQGTIGCLRNDDCMTGQMCSNGTCGAASTTGCTPACAAEETCVNGACVTSSSVDMAGGTVMTGSDGGTTNTSPSVGAACTDSSTCGTNGVCASTGTKKYCTVSCDPASATSCPSSYSCEAVGADHYCAPNASGGCDASGGSSMPLSSLLLLALSVLVLRRRPSAT